MDGVTLEPLTWYLLYCKLWLYEKGFPGSPCFIKFICLKMFGGYVTLFKIKFLGSMDSIINGYSCFFMCTRKNVIFCRHNYCIQRDWFGIQISKYNDFAIQVRLLPALMYSFYLTCLYLFCLICLHYMISLS